MMTTGGLILFVLVVIGCLFAATGSFRHGVLRMTKQRQMLMDVSAGAWTLSFFNDHVWLVRFGKEWRALYPTTWAVGWGDQSWFYIPAEKTSGSY